MTTISIIIDPASTIVRGDAPPIFSWLSDNIWSKGSLLTTDELVKQATGETLNPTHFEDHLRNRYL